MRPGAVVDRALPLLSPAGRARHHLDQPGHVSSFVGPRSGVLPWLWGFHPACRCLVVAGRP